MDCEDPDAGIEDEYHPKHDTMYCWRARRLLANHKLSVFEKMIDGSLHKGINELAVQSQRSGQFIELLSPEILEPEPKLEVEPKPPNKMKKSDKDSDERQSEMMEIHDTGVSEAKMEIEEGEEQEKLEVKESESVEEDVLEPAQKKQRKDEYRSGGAKNNNGRKREQVSKSSKLQVDDDAKITNEGTGVESGKEMQVDGKGEVEHENDESPGDNSAEVGAGSPRNKKKRARKNNGNKNRDREKK